MSLSLKYWYDILTFMLNYELVLLFDPVLGEAEDKALKAKIKKWLVGAKIEKEENWGRKKLAYLINKKVEATYHYYLFASDVDLLKNLEPKLKLEEKIMRYLIIKQS